MCHPNKGLHQRIKSVDKAYKAINKVSANRKKLAKQLAKEIKLSEAERFFLNNEDVLN